MREVYFRPVGSDTPVRAPVDRSWLRVCCVLLPFVLSGAFLSLRALRGPAQPVVASQVAMEILPTPSPKRKRIPVRSKRRSAPPSGSADPAVRKAFLSGNLVRAEELLSRRRGAVSPALASEIRYARCRRAVLREEWGTAIRSCEEAGKGSPHPRAGRILSRLSARARKLYLEGYAMERIDPEAALRKYRQALACAPSKSPYRAKAKTKLNGEARSETLTGSR